MQIKKKYQVFVSSTFEDLKEERMAVMQSLLDNDCIPVGMEQFPASGMSQMEYIKKMLDACDYYILILAGRYGSLDADGVGFTEKEFDYALSKSIPIMSFVVQDVGELPSGKCERTDKGKTLLEKFQKKVCAGRMVKFYSDIGNLKGEVATSINKCIRDCPTVGWVRGDSISPPEDVDAKIEAYLEKHEITQKTLAAIWQEIESKPNIHYGAEPPKHLKDGDIFLQIEKDER